MKGIFHIIGVGPGDPELLTLKGKRILEQCSIWFTPSAFTAEGTSTAYGIAAAAVSTKGKTILSHHFPMKKIHRKGETAPEVRKAWREGAKVIMQYLEKGENVAFPTLGDPTIYSTAFYILETLQEFGAPFQTEITPGIAAITAIAAKAQLPLCLGDEQLIIIPAAFENSQAKELLQQTGAAAFMKAGKALPRLIPLLEELDIIDNAVLIECCGQKDERIWNDIRLAAREKLHYFSTLIVRANRGE